MKNPTGSSDAPKCKLCAAFVALDMPSLTDLELPGTARFSRDSDICGACLKHDDAARVHLLTVEQQTGLVAGLLLAAFIALLAVIRLHNQLPRIATNMPPLVRGFGWFLIIMLAAVLPCAMLVWLVMQALFNLGIRCADRGCATKTAEHANRFY